MTLMPLPSNTARPARCFRSLTTTSALVVDMLAVPRGRGDRDRAVRDRDLYACLVGLSEAIDRA